MAEVALAGRIRPQAGWCAPGSVLALCSVGVALTARRKAGIGY